ncbi:hypothetical protein C8Q70DRAFT_940956 [Cubamyces menziesii]|nr:hypothetical protein C8Q70DRAFT_940956 [Cubamyces menziesii]
MRLNAPLSHRLWVRSLPLSHARYRLVVVWCVNYFCVYLPPPPLGSGRRFAPSLLYPGLLLYFILVLSSACAP